MSANLYARTNRKGQQTFYFNKHKLSSTEYNEILSLLIESSKELYAINTTNYGVTTTFYEPYIGAYKSKDSKTITKQIKIK